MSGTILIVCSGCTKKVDTPRCETDPPSATELHGVKCPDCSDGGFDMPEYFDANGDVVSADPETFI